MQLLPRVLQRAVLVLHCLAAAAGGQGPEGSAAALLAAGSPHAACLATVPRLDTRPAPAVVAAAVAAVPTAAAAVELL